MEMKLNDAKNTMKKIAVLIFGLLIMISCKKAPVTIDKNLNTSTTNVENDNSKAISIIKNFYINFYGNDNNIQDKNKMKLYVSERVIKIIDSLRDNDNLILDYDPFIKAQDYSGDVIKKTLKIEPLKNKDEYRVSFYLFEEKGEKRTDIDLLLSKNKDGNFLISSILNDDYLNFNKNVTTKTNTKENQWYGRYEGSFLRLKDESADPRGWATVTININKDSAVFNISSYVEEKSFKLKLKEQSVDSIIFNMEDNNLLKINKESKIYTLENTYIDNLISSKNKIKLNKARL